MKATIKKKLCWNCEGNVPRHADNCPYCGVYLHPTPEDKANAQEQENELTAPPFSNNAQHDDSLPHQPLYMPQEPLSKFSEPSSLPANNDEKVPMTDLRNILLALFSLLTGTAALIFGLVLALFSQNGILTLQWNGQYWYIYLIIAIPLLFLGWRFLQSVSDQSNEKDKF